MARISVVNNYILTSAGLFMVGAFISWLTFRDRGPDLAIWIYALLAFPITAQSLFISKCIIGSRLITYAMPRNKETKLKSILVIPVIIRSEDDLKCSLDALKRNAIPLKNKELDQNFVLLVDFGDSDTKVDPSDKAYMKMLQVGCASLNSNFSKSDGAFSVLVRERSWNYCAKKWMGWERKRGKLVEFAKFLRGDDCDKFTIYGEVDFNKRFEFMITLDRDARLIYDGISNLVQIASESKNMPCIVEGRVVSGYTFITPRLVLRHPSSFALHSFLSEFKRDWSIREGVEPNFLQDAYAQTKFMGKGLIHIDAYLTCVASAIKENKVLSHDHLEGALGRTAFAGDVICTEEDPIFWFNWLRKQFRWVKGDFLLLQWILVGDDSPLKTSRLSLFNRVLLLGNLLGPLSVISSLIIALNFIIFDEFTYALVVMCVSALPLTPIGVSLSLILAKNNDHGVLGILKLITKEFIQWLAKIVAFVPMWVTNAVFFIFAIFSALKGICVSCRHNLDWNDSDIRAFQYIMIAISVLIPMYVYIKMFRENGLNHAISLLLIVWMVAPLVGVIAVLLPRKRM